LTTVVLVVLAGLWVLVLGVPLLRERMEGTAADSIGSFRKQLNVLERAAPTVLPAANRLRVPTHQVTGGVLLPPVPSATARAIANRPSVLRKRQAQRRRREVLAVLVALIAGTLIAGFLPGMRMLWGVNIVLDMLFVAYVSLLIRLRNIAAEREMKLRFLPGAPAEPALLLRRSAN
jgi:hypothetical protein